MTTSMIKSTTSSLFAVYRLDSDYRNYGPITSVKALAEIILLDYLASFSLLQFILWM